MLRAKNYTAKSRDTQLQKERARFQTYINYCQKTYIYISLPRKEYR
jgi:hypothetical protein